MSTQTQPVTDTIEMVDDTILNNEEFKKNVAIPYFKDIYKDLVAQSDEKAKGVNKITMLQYSNLPGIIGERLFAVLDLSKSEFIDLREFVHGFFKVYYSNLETKIKLSFDIYDFDRDGYITKEDVRLILSHIPIVNTMTGNSIKEGSFTQETGRDVVFLDRIQTQEEIQLLVTTVFGDKKRINYEDYVKINQEVSSELFLSILILFQTNSPCSVNYYRYKNNYEKYVDVSKDGKSEDQPVIKTIASPRIMSKLSPVQMLVNQQNINVNPTAQKGLLKYAMNKQQVDEINYIDESDDDGDVDHTKFGSKREKNEKKAKRAAELQHLQA